MNAKTVRLMVVALSLLLVSCRNAKESESSAEPPKTNNELSAEQTDLKSSEKKEVLISAAASTKEIMESLGSAFSEQSKADVKVNPGPSNNLANQIVEGAPADLFLSASREWATKVADEKLAASSVELLTNKLVLIVPKGNPANVKSPEDLKSDAVKKIALAGEKVPAGKYAEQVLTKLGLFETLNAAGKIARGQDVRGALAFVDRGEAESGIVYSTDVGISPGVEIVHEFDPQLHDEIVYVLVLLKHGSENSSAKQFFEYLQSDAANAIYEKAGFTRLKPKSSDSQ